MDKKEMTLKFRTCPQCGQRYIGAPAISRKDQCTAICQDCGTREALRSIGCPEDEIEKILGDIHKKIEQTAN